MSGAKLPYLTLADLTVIFGYANERETRRALRRGTLAVPTYKLLGKVVADREVVHAFFAKKRAEGMAELNSTP